MLEIIDKNKANLVRTYFNKYDSYKKINGISVKSCMNKDKEISLYINELQKTVFINNTHSEIIKLLFGIISNEIHEDDFKCIGDNCNNILNLSSVLKHHHSCSKYCATHNELRRTKTKETLLANYGVVNVFCLDSVKNKIKQTCLQRYGVEYAQQTDLVKEKAKQTNLKKYGTVCSLWNEEIHQKSLNTLKKKYGVDHSFKIDSVKEKIKSTNLERYGVENPMQSEKIRKQAEQTCLKKYGVDNPWKSSSIREKSLNTLQNRYGVNHPALLSIQTSNDHSWNNILSWNEHVIPLFDRNDYKGYDHAYKWKCTKCGNEFEQKICPSHNVLYPFIPRCLNCYPKFSSKGEYELTEFCKQYFDNVIENIKSIIKPYELDIVIPEIKLAIEFDGIYYHSIEARNSFRLSSDED